MFGLTIITKKRLAEFDQKLDKLQAMSEAMAITLEKIHEDTRPRDLQPGTEKYEAPEDSTPEPPPDVTVLSYWELDSDEAAEALMGSEDDTIVENKSRTIRLRGW